MRILLLNQAFYPDVVSTAQHAADLAGGLAIAGHSVTVMASRHAYDSPALVFPAKDSWYNLTCLRVPSTTLGKSARWRRALDFGSFLLACLIRLAWLPRFDVVIAMTSPPLIAVLAALFVRMKGGALVSWLMDLNPDEAIAAGALRRDSQLARVLSRLLRFSLEASSLVVVLDKFMRDRVVSKGVPLSRIAILPPWAHAVIQYEPRGRDEFRAFHGLTDKFVVMYSGNHSPCHPLGTVLEAAREMRAQPDVAFVFVGGGSEFQKVGDFAALHLLDNILCLPYQPLEALGDSLSAADMQLVVMGDPFVGVVHPCKIYNILAIGSPCFYIGPSPSHVTEIAESLPADSIFCASHGDVASVVQRIRRAAALGPGRSIADAHLAVQVASSGALRMIEMVESLGKVAPESIPATAVLS